MPFLQHQFVKRYIYLLLSLLLVYLAMIGLSAVDLNSVWDHPLAVSQWEFQPPYFIIQQAGGITFVNWYNQQKILEQAAINLALSVGITFVILTGGIDLSVGSMLSLCNVVFVTTVLAWQDGAVLSGEAFIVGLLVCLGVGLFCGIANGWLSVALNIPSFIVTLGTLLILEGVAFWVSGGRTRILACPATMSVWIPLGFSILVVVLSWVFLSTTRWGRQVYAVGGNLLASRFAGIHTGRIRIMCFAFSGLCAAMGGIIFWSRLSIGSYTAGKGLELYAIAAVVLGGTRLSGGEGTILGTLLGVMIMAVLANGLNTAGVDELTQKIIVGAVLVVAAYIDSRRSRRPDLVAV